MSSKYDVVKLKVRLSEDHFYILSRFQLSRMLMFCQIPEPTAIKIALDVKRLFVNCDRLEVWQADLDETLTAVMLSYGYGEANSLLLPVITTFYAERLPFVLLISGAPGSGKTTIAQLLAARLSCSTVLSADVLLDVADAIAALPTSGATGGAEAWTAACTRVHAVIAAEMRRALAEGKVLIAEGAHISLPLYAEYLSSSQPESVGAIVIGVYLTAPMGTRATTAAWGGGSGREAEPSTSPPLRLHDCEGATYAEKELDKAFAVESGGGIVHLLVDGIDRQGLTPAGNEVPSDSRCSSAVWKVSTTNLSLLTAAADVLHARILGRIIAGLVERGSLDASRYQRLHKQ